MTAAAALWLALAAAPAHADTRHTVVSRDTLWDLAAHYYRDPYQWRRIHDANPPPGVHDPHWIYPGQVLVIPDGAPPAEPDVPALEVEQEAPPPPPVRAPARRAPVKFESDTDSESTVTLPESLSTRIPEGLVAMPPSNYRLLALPGWEPDGLITGFDETEIMAAEGDAIDVEVVRGEAEAGARFLVFRRAAPTEADSDKTATYLVKLGLITIKRPLSGKHYRAVILKSSDSLQVGDLIKRGQ